MGYNIDTCKIRMISLFQHDNLMINCDNNFCDEDEHDKHICDEDEFDNNFYDNGEYDDNFCDYDE